jgi:hypothetical protein
MYILHINTQKYMIFFHYRPVKNNKTGHMTTPYISCLSFV